MKTKTISTDNQVVNELNYIITKIDREGNDVEIKIRLSDPCCNGHNDFSITGSVYEKGKPHTDRYCIRGGAIGDYIAEQFPEFSVFNRLHLSDAHGVPMYAIANGFYHLTAGFNDKNKDLKTEFCQYYRVSQEQFDVLLKAKDQDYYGYLLGKLGIIEQWKAEAVEAIKLLETLTGEKFKDNSVKSNLDALTPDKIAEIESLIKEGYYSPANIEKREAEKQKAAKEALLQEAEDKFSEATTKAKTELEKDKILINLFGTTSNVIVYNHNKEVVFNWSPSSYNKAYTEAEFNQFVKAAEENEYLKGYKFKIGR